MLTTTWGMRGSQPHSPAAQIYLTDFIASHFRQKYNSLTMKIPTYFQQDSAILSVLPDASFTHF